MQKRERNVQKKKRDPRAKLLFCLLNLLFFFVVVVVFLTFALPSASLDLKACLHGVGDPSLMGLVSIVFTLWGTQNKRNLPH